VSRYQQTLPVSAILDALSESSAESHEVNLYIKSGSLKFVTIADDLSMIDVPKLHME
jgi:hypothetical protein